MRTLDASRALARALVAASLAALAGHAIGTEEFSAATEGTGTRLAAAAAALGAPQLAAVAFEAGSPGIERYKAEVARRIVAASPDRHTTDLPPILKSIVVLDISVDRTGRPVRVVVWRSNGYEELEARALDSVRLAAGALPPPAEGLLGGGDTVRFLETFLFRHDGRFQIRSLEPATMPVGGAGVARR